MKENDIRGMLEKQMRLLSARSQGCMDNRALAQISHELAYIGQLLLYYEDEYRRVKRFMDYSSGYETCQL